VSAGRAKRTARALRHKKQRKRKRRPPGTPFSDARKTAWDSRRGDCLLGAEHTETLIEAVDTAAGIQHFLLAGVERVALGANVDAQVLGQRRASLDDVAAAASGVDFYVSRMDIGFHWINPQDLCR